MQYESVREMMEGRVGRDTGITTDQALQMLGEETTQDSKRKLYRNMNKLRRDGIPVFSLDNIYYIPETESDQDKVREMYAELTMRFIGGARRFDKSRIKNE